MALINCDFFSETLGMCVSMIIILPQKSTAGQIGIKNAATTRNKKTAFHGHPTLWLLHGLSDDHTIWLRRTSIERYVAPLGLAVVMPAVGRSFYADMVTGPRYWTFISQELPALARQFFPLSPRREDNFVAGLSMGGYGAFKLALAHPDRYAAGASLSGALDIAGRLAAGGMEERHAEMRRIFGDFDQLPASSHDLIHLATQLVKSGKPRPALYQACGKEDFLYDQNQTFRKHAKKIGLQVKYEEDAGYGHDWGYWDLTIQRVLKWLPLAAGKKS